MDELTALLASLDVGSVIFGAVIGLLCGAVIARLARPNVRKALTDLSGELQSSLDNVSSETLQKSTEELSKSNESLLTRLEDKSRFQSEQHSTELESKKALIDQQLEQMSDTLKIVPNELEKNQYKVNEVLQQSTEQLKESNQNYLNQLAEKTEAQTKEHIKELEAKKKLIDQQLEQMSKTLETVPTELEKNQNKVAEVLDKSTKSLKESNQNYLNQLAEKSETQTKEHSKELETKKELIDQRLSDMDVKLGKVERLVQDLQTDRKTQYSALDEQLRSLTSTTTSLQKALADNRERGRWGERIAEDILRWMGLLEGRHYEKQLTTSEGKRPDFTFHLPNDMTLNMDVKFPLDNYERYHNATNDKERQEFSEKFLRDVNSRVTEIHQRGYISAETVDCVLIFIPNEQVYRFIHERDHTIIDKALQQKVILCSPLTLYVVLALIRQAAQNFNVERKSREIVDIVNEIRSEWTKYTDKMGQLENTFGTMQKRFHELTFTRTRALDRRFGRIEGLLESNELKENREAEIPLLSEENA